MAIVITNEGDVLDGVCYNFYGMVDGNILQEVLDANQNIQDHGIIFEAGVEITLPDEIQATQVRTVVKLWD